MQIGQGLAVIEPSELRHKPFDQLQHAVGAVDKAAQHLVGVGSLARARVPRKGSARRAPHPPPAADTGR